MFNETLFNFKSCLMRRTDHKSGTPCVARRPWLVIYIHQSDSSSCSDCASVTLHSILSIMLCVIGYSCGMTVFICTSIQKQRLHAMDDHLIKPLKVCISYQCNVDLDQCFEWIFMSRGDNDCCTAKCLPLKSGRITQSLNQKN